MQKCSCCFFLVLLQEIERAAQIITSTLATAKVEFTKLFRAVRLKRPKRKKLLEAARPERAEALSPGQRPGLLRTQTCRPVRAKALKLQTKLKAFSLTGL